MIKVYQSGNTVRMLAQFYDANDNITDPDLIEFRIYNYKYEELSKEVVPPENKLSNGAYYLDYTLPTEAGYYIYEWYYEKDGMPKLRREKIRVDFLGHW